MKSHATSPYSCAAETRTGKSRRGPRIRRTALCVTFAALVAGGAAIAGGCGDDGVESQAHADTIHVHGLGIDAADGALLLGTHTGLFRLAPGASAPQRVGDLFHDLMGLTVAGPDRLLASGHPDLRTDLPVRLGLVESRDGGESWQPVSLLGEADLHVLRASDLWVYAADGMAPVLRMSADGGSTWKTFRTPAPLADLAIHPSEPSRLVASSQAGLVMSSDGGRTWRSMTGPPGLMSWPVRDALYAIEPAGTVWSSADQGRRWTRVGDAGGIVAAVTATADVLYVALEDGSLRRSGDRGRSWQSISAA